MCRTKVEEIFTSNHNVMRVFKITDFEGILFGGMSHRERAYLK